VSEAQRPRYNVVVPTRYGMMIVNRNDWVEADGVRYGVGHDLLATGEYVQAELDTLAALIAQCPPDPVLLDIGANIGVHSLLFSALAGPAGRVHAFEAQRIVFQMLMGNLALNSIENVHGHGTALGAAPGTLSLPPLDYNKPWNFGGVALAAGTAASTGQTETVTVATLDSLDLARVDFIKLDVEGMEEDVLRGARRTLDRTRPLMQVEWMMRDQGRLPLYLLEHLDYRVFQAGMNLLCIPVERGAAINPQGVPEMTADAVRQAYKL
jgi:FkbM family methyltransferase